VRFLARHPRFAFRSVPDAGEMSCSGNTGLPLTNSIKFQGPNRTVPPIR
jgi:hypothetical protein